MDLKKIGKYTAVVGAGAGLTSIIYEATKPVDNKDKLDELTKLLNAQRTLNDERGGTIEQQIKTIEQQVKMITSLQAQLTQLKGRLQTFDRDSKGLIDGSNKVIMQSNERAKELLKMKTNNEKLNHDLISKQNEINDLLAKVDKITKGKNVLQKRIKELEINCSSVGTRLGNLIGNGGSGKNEMIGELERKIKELELDLAQCDAKRAQLEHGGRGIMDGVNKLHTSLNNKDKKIEELYERLKQELVKNSSLNADLISKQNEINELLAKAQSGSSDELQKQLERCKNELEAQIDESSTSAIDNQKEVMKYWELSLNGVTKETAENWNSCLKDNGNPTLSREGDVNTVICNKKDESVIT